uniref:ATP synthase F0 subunit 8 n=1 Tax=Paratrioza sinica TaxID=1511640 RepID=A0A068F115_9HEMI|nr:ATP synthase F0 subunit 8 [Paratrioza sinica]AID54942.1 ATP synthase F0 subunit 8 [Paratrioza sinica]
MPQMSPLPWTLLCILTLVSLISISSIIYFSTQQSTYHSILNMKHKLSFKW